MKAERKKAGKPAPYYLDLGDYPSRVWIAGREIAAVLVDGRAVIQVVERPVYNVAVTPEMLGLRSATRHVGPEGNER